MSTDRRHAFIERLIAEADAAEKERAHARLYSASWEYGDWPYGVNLWGIPGPLLAEDVVRNARIARLLLAEHRGTRAALCGTGQKWAARQEREMRAEFRRWQRACQKLLNQQVASVREIVDAADLPDPLRKRAAKPCPRQREGS
jgi:hypothetical protein